jgi:hypothetical protein
MAIAAATESDYNTLADLLINMSERSRRAAANKLREVAYDALVKEQCQTIRMEASPGWENASRTSHVVLAGTTLRKERSGPPKFMGGRYGGTVSRDLHRLPDVYRARPIEALDLLAKAAMYDGQPHALLLWHEFLQAGLIQKPDPLQLAFTLSKVDNVVDLADNPGLALEYIRCLRFEPALNNLCPYDVVSSAREFVERLTSTWPYRQELIGELLTLQARDAKRKHANFLCRVTEFLEPSGLELGAHVNELILVLGNGRSTNKRFAAELLCRVIRSGGVIEDEQSLRFALESALLEKEKGTALQVLKLLEMTLLDHHTKAEIAMQALAHGSMEVQEKAIEQLEKLAPLPAHVVDGATKYASSVSQSLRQRLHGMANSQDPDHLGIDNNLGTVKPTETQDSPEQSFDERSRRLQGRATAIPHAVRAKLHLNEVFESLDRKVNPMLPIFGAEDSPRLARAIPITDPDDLVETLMSLVGGLSDPMDFDRLIDGLARTDPRTVYPGLRETLLGIGGSSPSDSLRSASDLGLQSLKAVRYWLHIVSNFVRGETQLNITADEQKLTEELQLGTDALCPVWPATVFPNIYGDGFMGFVGARLTEAILIAGVAARPTLAFPSTCDGWIDASDFADRLHQIHGQNQRPARLEAIHALLRLHPVADDLAIERLRLTKNPIALAARIVVGDQPLQRSNEIEDEGLRRAVRVSQGGRLQKQAVGSQESSSGSSVAFIPASLRFDVLERKYESWTRVRFAPLVPVPNLEQRRDDPLGNMVSQIEMPIVPTEKRTWWDPVANPIPWDDRGEIRWAALAFPRDSQMLNAGLASRIAEDIETNRSSDLWHSGVVGLADPDRPLHFSGHALLAVALSAKSTTVGAASVDVFASAGSDGRLDPTELGKIFGELTNAELLKPARIAARLRLIANDSLLIADSIRRTLISWLESVQTVPLDANAILELLEHVCASTNQSVDVDLARLKLGSITAGSSKTAKTAQRLLTMAGSPNPEVMFAAAEVVVARAERWSRGTLRKVFP